MRAARWDKDKTALATHLGTYEYTRMPFCIKNAPATFHRALDNILSGVWWQACLIYLDGIILISKTVPKHITDLQTLLTVPQDAGTLLKLKNCFFPATARFFRSHR